MYIILKYAKLQDVQLYSRDGSIRQSSWHIIFKNSTGYWRQPPVGDKQHRIILDTRAAEIAGRSFDEGHKTAFQWGGSGTTFKWLLFRQGLTGVPSSAVSTFRYYRRGNEIARRKHTRIIYEGIKGLE